METRFKSANCASSAFDSQLVRRAPRPEPRTENRERTLPAHASAVLSCPQRSSSSPFLRTSSTKDLQPVHHPASRHRRAASDIRLSLTRARSLVRSRARACARIALVCASHSRSTTPNSSSLHPRSSILQRPSPSHSLSIPSSCAPSPLPSSRFSFPLICASLRAYHSSSTPLIPITIAAASIGAQHERERKWCWIEAGLRRD